MQSTRMVSNQRKIVCNWAEPGEVRWNGLQRTIEIDWSGAEMNKGEKIALEHRWVSCCSLDWNGIEPSEDEWHGSN